MKTINDIAKEAGLSRQTVYARVKDCQLSLDELTARKQGNKRLFDDKAVKIILSAIVKEEENKETVSDSLTVKELSERARQLEEQLAEERQKTADAMAEIERLKKLEEVNAQTIAAQAITIQQQQTQYQLKLTEGHSGIIHILKAFFAKDNPM